MYKLLFAAGAASLALAASAAADPGKNKGHGNQAKHSQTMHHGQDKHQAKYSRQAYQGRTTANYWGNRSGPQASPRKVMPACRQASPGAASTSVTAGTGITISGATIKFRQIGAISTTWILTTGIITATAISTASTRRLA